MVEFRLNFCKIRPRRADNRGRQINSFREGVERGDFKLMRTRLFVIGLDMSPLPTPDLPRFFLGVKLCRPSEVIRALLEKWPPGPFAKEDGELILDRDGQRVS